MLLSGGTPELAEWLAPVLPNLVAGPPRHPAFAVLGVRRLPLAELADLLASLDREPPWWRGLYAALAGAPAEEMAELGALPVPLADGRLVRGPRGLLLPGAGLDHPDRLAVLGLRVVAPEAAHPLLARLGAVEATPRSVLDDAATRAAVAASYDNAVEASYDDDGPERVADAVLGLVAALNAEPGEYPYLADLALPGDDGDWYPAGELLLPGSPLAEVIAPDGPFGTIEQAALDRHGAKALEAVGVHFSFGLLTAEDVELDESAIDLDLDGAADWAADSRARLGDDTASGLPYGSLPPVALEVTGRARPRPGRSRPLAAGTGAPRPSAAAGGADRAGPGSGSRTAATRTCRPTPPGGSGPTWSSTAAARATCAPRILIPCWRDCTTPSGQARTRS